MREGLQTQEHMLLSTTSGSLTTTYTTDLFGRRTEARSSAGVTAYDWDDLGHLARITSEDSTSTYAYGPTGMRERAVVESSEGTTTAECVWSGQQLAMSRVSTAAGERTYRFVYGPSGLPLELIAYEGTTKIGSYAYVCDRAGSVIGLTDAAGTLVAWYTYDPWGNPLGWGGTDARLAADNPLRYRGYYFDEATGLYYMPARYYDPSTARFLSSDPASPSAGDPLTLNRYAYCVGDPVNFEDRTGARHEAGGGGGGGATANNQPTFADAARSTVYGVTKWTAANSSRHMTQGMRTLLASYELRYGPGGPPHVTQSEICVALNWEHKPNLTGHGQADLSTMVRIESYSDFNITLIVPIVTIVGLGPTGGVITNRTEYWDGHVERDSHAYLGVTGGLAGYGNSLMWGSGRTDPGGYVEGSGGFALGGALGYGFESGGYSQGGISTFGAQASVFHVW